MREHLFKALEDVGSGKMDLERAKVVCEIGQVIINTARVEVDYVKHTGRQVDGLIQPATTGRITHQIK
ncbi:hypothetical protein [Deefgea sp. CFH1-16]|uniref:hypothetical protein n=1 Tax=Deefgea sp. CFH1-16 TaxID=2675457 RepID=UPI0015F3BA23|nr:hypothetical protein [Deefgea sp. CFH1-16]MBM5575799.1 hypothetical protein [Deefgea sp. CFH1-16]